MRNVVYIETYKRTGSGVLLECDVDFKSAIKADEKSYIVLTNYHVIQDLNTDMEEQRDYIDLKIRDVDGELIDSRFITHVFVASGNNYDSSSDIAALLVIIKDCCKIVCTNDIYMETENKLSIESEGYPHVFQNDLINRELCLKGEVEKYNKQEIGIYKIVDDYHGYSDISDKALLEGFSGAPVYSVYENKEYLIGINQSLCNIGNGKNPFKIVYFLGIHRVLDWLRSQGIILYEYKHKHVKILWINKILHNKEMPLLDLNKPKRIVLIGGSGAGKSSFMKTLCRNGDILGSVGDGQTTRTTISYELSVYCHRPRISIYFQNKQRFVENRIRQIRLRLLELNLCYRFGMDKKNIVTNPLVYLQDLILPLGYLANQENDERMAKLVQHISKTLYLCEMGDDLEEYEDMIRVAYEKVIDFLEEYCKYTEESEQSNQKQLILQKMLSKKKLENYLKNHPEKDANDYYKFVQQDKEKLIIDDDYLRNDFREIITQDDGYFNISEFYYLDSENEMQSFCDELFNKYFLINGSLFWGWHSLESAQDVEEDNQQSEGKEMVDQENIKYMSLYSRIKEYYREFYVRVAFLLNLKNTKLSEKKEIELQNATIEEKSLISKCMRKVGGDSLSGIIEYISVIDSFSNDYAFNLYQNKMNRLTFFDTCGVDHIDRGNQTIYYRNLFNKIKGDKNYKPIDAIIYIKKLDSEKPTELEATLPVINRLEEATPIFCIFTAVDQFIYGKEEYIDQMVWNRESYEKWKNIKESQEFIFPKVIQNMHENPSFVNKIHAPEQIKKKIYRFLLNHMVPFSSRYQLNDDHIIEQNRNSLNIIFGAILKDEWNIGFIPSIESLDNDNRDKLQKAIGHDLENMFLYASRCDWEKRHHSTIAANFRRIYRYDEYYDKTHEELGFNRTQIDRWDNLLQQGFSDSFLGEGKTLDALKDVFGISFTKAYSILSRIKNAIIKIEMGVWQTDDNKSKFRKYFEEMYENKDVYPVNVFERQGKSPQEEYGNNDSRIKFLNQHCNFHKGLTSATEIEHKIVEYIYHEIENMLQDENKNYIDTLKNYDSKFKDSVEYIEKIIKEYSDEKFVKGKNENEIRAEVWMMISESMGCNVAK